MKHRIAFLGASGTGKTTLAKWLANELEYEINPVGSRSVAKAMGFDSPYDVDEAGMRPAFQAKLRADKAAWEAERDEFITDRTPIDNLTYTTLHSVYAITDEVLTETAEQMKRYTMLVYCPSSAFLDTAGDPNRVEASAYHKVYDIVLQSYMAEYGDKDKLIVLSYPDLENRKRALCAGLFVYGDSE